MKNCLIPGIPQIEEAACHLDEAVTAHFAGQPLLATELIHRADMPEIGEWTESLWGRNKPYIVDRSVSVTRRQLTPGKRSKQRMPNVGDKLSLHARDGYHCRFCGIPVMRKVVRNKFRVLYPEVARWGLCNRGQHTALQAMDAHYDHLVPHSRDGDSSSDNMVVTCAPCNYSRMHYTLEEVGLAGPRLREPTLTSTWNGLERLILKGAA
jgi:5-methylcytosine-specific restriction endonuclease McrA